MFAKRLNATRKRRGITAQHMADVLGMRIRAYRNYESGDRFPSPASLVRIADELDVSLDYLLGRDEFMRAHGAAVDECL